MGAGRKPETGETRGNRVVAFLSDREYDLLAEYAEERDLPIGSAVYRILARFLARRRP